jgi:hypothetical protein
MQPNPQSSAMRDVVANLMQFDDANRFFGEMISGLSVRYDLGSEVDAVGRLIGDRPIGRGASLYELMQDGMGVLLDASIDSAASRLVAALAPNTSPIKIRCVATDTGPSMLIRPDACIAWTSEENSVDRLERALRRWFVPAAAHAGMMLNQ